LRISKPMEGIDYKLIVINPCKMPESNLAEVVPSKPDNTRNTITPPLRFKVPSAGELKTPSEMLKEFALPKNPKKEQR
jgi:hypothetical protein